MSSTHSSAAVPYKVVAWEIVNHGFQNRPAREIRNAAMLHSDNYYEAEKYAKNTAYLCVAIVAAGILPGLFHRFRCRYPQQAVRLMDRLAGIYPIVAFSRKIAYYQPRPLKFLVYWQFPSVGPLFLTLIFSLGITLYCLCVQPWYRLNREWGSPPLAIRAGMIANGLFPVLFALSTKVNVITMLTAISHERLQLYHQWVGRLLLLFTIIHFVPFIWQPLHEGGLKDLQSYWYSDPIYWNGSVAMGLLIWIILSGSRFARNWKYEFFVINHIFSVLAFMTFYFIHTNNYLNSWTYLWIAIYLWIAAIFIRWCQSSLASRYFVRTRASVELTLHSIQEQEDGERDEVVRIAINTPVKWKPGQHTFIRFPTLAPFQSHPFTIITLPNPSKNKESQIVCVARVLKGNTKSLRDRIRKQILDVTEKDVELIESSSNVSLLGKQYSSITEASLIPAIIDGPYGADCSIVASYECALFVVGGLGLTFALPTMMFLVHKKDSLTKRIRLIWSIRTTALLNWFEPYLMSIFEESKSVGITIEMEIHITREQVQPELKKPYANFHADRPDSPTEVKATFKDCEQKGDRSLAVVTCGPSELMRSTANATSSLQSSILSKNAIIREIYLIHESFGW